MRIQTNGNNPDTIQLVCRAGSVALTKGTDVYFEADGITVTTASNSRPAGKLLQNLAPGNFGYTQVYGIMLDGSFVSSLGAAVASYMQFSGGVTDQTTQISSSTFLMIYFPVAGTIKAIYSVGYDGRTISLRGPITNLSSSSVVSTLPSVGTITFSTPIQFLKTDLNVSVTAGQVYIFASPDPGISESAFILFQPA